MQVHDIVGEHSLDNNVGVNGDQKDPNVGLSSRPDNDPSKGARNIFLPLDHHDGSNPEIRVVPPYPGVIIYRFQELFNYPNASRVLDDLTDQVFRLTQRTNPNAYARLGDRPWNDPGKTRKQTGADPNDHRPTLKAVILDFSAVNNVDVYVSPIPFTYG